MYKILTIENNKEWNDLLTMLPIEQNDIYYTPELYRLYECNGDGKAICFVYEENGEIALYPFLLNHINKIGYDLEKDYYDIQGCYGYNGVITSCQNDIFIANFYKCFSQFSNDNNIIAEFSRFHPIIRTQIFSNDFLNCTFNRLTIGVNLLDTIDIIENNFSKMAMRAISKAKRNDIYIKIYNSDFKKDEFAEIYNQTMKRVNSIDYLFFNKEYFNNLFRLKNIVQFCAYLGDKLIASTVCFFSGSYFHYHLGCSKYEYLSYRPNNLLFFYMVRYAKDNNFKILHLGGGNTSSKEDTLLKFKQNFSKLKYDFFIGNKIYNIGIYNKIINQWANKYPEKKDMYNNIFLRYRL
ncbi:MAG: GNAT family N-acetyltransferase [Bacteroidales bacterium]|nr:GNAT family N-acetyltransferase [Bacteroidales bacterium]